MTEHRDGRVIITTPITDEDVKGLRAGDTFYLSGDMVTGRDDVHERVVREGLPFPADIKGKALFHAGPIVKTLDDGSYEIISIGPTTSMRMEKYESDFIEKTGVKLIIGKGGMGAGTVSACVKHSAICSAAPAGCSLVCAEGVEEVCGVSWTELGMPEAVWHFKLKEFGPLTVTIDSEGRNYFEELKSGYKLRAEEQKLRLLKKLR